MNEKGCWPKVAGLRGKGFQNIGGKSLGEKKGKKEKKAKER